MPISFLLLGECIIANALTQAESVPRMYGPPRDCKYQFGREDKSAAMYSAFDGAACSWPG
jgi:hypothetical protein